ncbi:unnamed protein product [Rhodiola kirilowii]
MELVPRMIPRSSLHHPVRSLFAFAVASFLVIGTLRLFLENSKHNQNNILHQISAGLVVNITNDDGIKNGCNVFQGRWVWDNDSCPLYAEDTCPYLVKQVTCQRNGRSDSAYQNWRWQPNSCNLPRFDPLKLLEVLRNKRLMFVGDSIQRGQFESMVCLVQSVIPDGSKSLRRVPPMKIFEAKEYNMSIEYYWAPFLVESISDHATNHTVMKRMVRLDSINKHGDHWKGVDVLVFESYVWWMHNPFINASYGSPQKVKEYDVPTAYELALKTWAKWLESAINPENQQIFLMSMSPTHLWSWEWRPGTDENCFNESQPIKKSSYWGTGSSLDIMRKTKDMLDDLSVKVTFLNITQLSEFRKDGHTSIYGERRGKLLTREQKSDPKKYADCIHWCLPGVPDTWNEILYAHLLQNYLVQKETISKTS